jgi:ArsR family transcriptional regulator
MVNATKQPDILLGWISSLSDPARLRLLRLLEQQELSVAQLCDVLQMPQSTISRHLKVLVDQSWTQNRRVGTASLYHMILDELDPAARRLWLIAREQIESWPAIDQDQLRLARRQSEQEAQADKFFAGAAADWDKRRSELYGTSFTHSATLALLPSHWTVADLGCGTGVVCVDLARNVQRVIGVDHSSAMLKAARKRIATNRKDAAIGEIDLRRGELENLPIDDASCDAALMIIVLTYLPDPAVALREMHRILKPGGKAVVIDLLLHDRDDFRRQMEQRCMGFADKQLTHMLIDAGLSDTICRPLPPEKDAKGPALLLASATRL